MSKALSFYIFILFAGTLLMPFFAVVPAEAADGYRIVGSLPGTSGIGQGTLVRDNVSLQEYVGQIYLFALSIVGLVALAAIVYQSIRYILAAGNAGQMSDALGGIWDAVLGLTLLLVAAGILQLINPALTSLQSFERFPELDPPATSNNPHQGSGRGHICFGGDCRVNLACAESRCDRPGLRTCQPKEFALNCGS